jgi:hypothetical protein
MNSFGYATGNSFVNRRHTVDNYLTTQNQVNQVISIDDQSNKMTETNKGGNMRNDDLTHFL